MYILFNSSIKIINFNIFLGIIISLWCFLLHQEQLTAVYHYTLFTIDMTLILYLNLYNTIDFGGSLITRKTGLSLWDIFIVFPIVVGAWVFYIASVILYSRGLQTKKPIGFAFSTTPIFIHHISFAKEGEDPPIWLCVFVFMSTYLALNALYTAMHGIARYMWSSFTVAKWLCRMYGWTVLFVFHWRRLYIADTLTVFWAMVFGVNLIIQHICSMEPISMLALVFSSVAHSCTSLLTMLSMCFIIYKICNFILTHVKNFYHDDHIPIEESNSSPSGVREACGFFFLALYTGVASCEPSRKMYLLELIFYLLLAALIRSMFEVVEPVLLALSSLQSAGIRKHFRVLGFIFLLLVSAFYLAFSVYEMKDRIPFMTPNIITIAQIVAALVLYSLYCYDAQHEGVWEELDDYVYYVNGGCRVFEFGVIAVVLCYRLCDFTLEWTLFQIAMALLHIYVNIWQPAREGWQSLRKRHQVYQKLNALPEASQDEIKSLEDVCPICLEELKSARVTPCNHFFHNLCLRKWLKVQNKCPMCHANILSL